MKQETMEPIARTDVRDVAERAVRTLAAGVLPGLVTGVIVGGLGSRLVMRTLAVTSPNSHGFQTDFGATVGEITAKGTVGLVILGGVVGMIGGVIFLALRGLLPKNPWLGGLAFGVVLLAVSGRLLVDPNNLDFVILSPLPLAVALFTALPLIFGLAFVPLATWLEPALLGTRHLVVLSLLVLAGLLPLALLGGFGVLVVAVTMFVAWIGPSIGPGARRTMRRAGTILLAAVVLAGGAWFVDGLIELF